MLDTIQIHDRNKLFCLKLFATLDSNLLYFQCLRLDLGNSASRQAIFYITSTLSVLFCVYISCSGICAGPLHLYNTNSQDYQEL